METFRSNPVLPAYTQILLERRGRVPVEASAATIGGEKGGARGGRGGSHSRWRHEDAGLRLLSGALAVWRHSGWKWIAKHAVPGGGGSDGGGPVMEFAQQRESPVTYGRAGVVLGSGRERRKPGRCGCV